MNGSGEVRRGRPSGSKVSQARPSGGAFDGLGWFEDAKQRIRDTPDLATAAAVLNGLENDDVRRRVAHALLSFLVPVYPDLEAWTAWATHGGQAPDKRTWAAEKRVNGKSRARRNMSRMVGSASRLDAEETDLRSQIAELTAQADAVADQAEAYRDQARVFTIQMLDISLQSSISQACSMGAGYVVLKAIAQTGRGQSLLAQIDAWSTDAGFLEALGSSIAAVVDHQNTVAGKAPMHRYSTGEDRTKTFLNALPEGADAASLRMVLSALIPSVDQAEGAPGVGELSMDTVFELSEQTGPSVERDLEQRATLATELPLGKAELAKPTRVSGDDGGNGFGP